MGILNLILNKKVHQGSLLNLLPSLKSKLLFYGLYSEIADGKMPNKVGSDWLTVSGVAGSETYQCPNTASYIAADTDFIWFKTDATQRTTTTAELVGYDLQRTPIKYDDATPYQVREIAIIKSGETLTEAERNNLFKMFWLPVFWDNALNAFGHVKENRIGQNLWTPEYVELLGVELSGNVILDADMWWSKEVGVTISGGTANFNAVVAKALRKFNILVVGHTYRITFDLVERTSVGGYLKVISSPSLAFYDTPNTYTQKFIANDVWCGLTGFDGMTGKADNISIKEVLNP